MVVEDGIDPPTRGFSIFSDFPDSAGQLDFPGVLRVYSGIDVDLHLSNTSPQPHGKESSSLAGALNIRTE